MQKAYLDLIRFLRRTLNIDKRAAERIIAKDQAAQNTGGYPFLVPAPKDITLDPGNIWLKDYDDQRRGGDPSGTFNLVLLRSKASSKDKEGPFVIPDFAWKWWLLVNRFNPGPWINKILNESNTAYFLTRKGQSPFGAIQMPAWGTFGGRNQVKPLEWFPNSVRVEGYDLNNLPDPEIARTEKHRMHIFSAYNHGVNYPLYPIYMPLFEFKPIYIERRLLDPNKK